jgi:hypothetical protein
MSDDTDCLNMGDFNLIQRSSDRNKPGGNVRDMLNFNAAISSLRLEELKFNGNKFTWINKQESPLLERLDSAFASPSWMTNNLGYAASTLSRDISDHYLCLISISTDIPIAMIFRFENYWMMREGVNHGKWMKSSRYPIRCGKEIGPKIQEFEKNFERLAI